MNPSNDILKMALSQMQRTINPVTLTAWFDDATVVEFVGNVLTLHVPNDFKKEIIETRFMEPLTAALRELFDDEIGVVLTTGEIENPGGVSYGLTPDDEYTFDHFIVGNSNKFAHAAALSVANQPAQYYNPLFIYGQIRIHHTFPWLMKPSLISCHNKALVRWVFSSFRMLGYCTQTSG